MNNAKGLWWIPEKPELKLAGDLIYFSEENPVLFVEGFFEEVNLREVTFSCILKKNFYEVVVGEINEEKFTLINSVVIDPKITLTGTGDSCSSKLSPAIICKGHHFSNKKELVFEKILVNYSNIGRWLGTGGVKGIKREQDPYVKDLAETSLIANVSPNLLVEIPYFLQKDQIKIFNYYSETAVVQFKFPEQKLFITDILKIIDNFRNFLRIFIDDKVSIREVKANTEFGSMQLIIPQFTNSAIKDSISSRGNIILKRKFIQKFEYFTSNWIAFVEKFYPTHQLFFSDNFEDLYLSTKLLNCSQAIESYYTRNSKYNNKSIADDDKDEIIESSHIKDIILGKFPEKNVISSLFSKLQWLNEKSLRVKLKELYQDYGNILKYFIRDKNDFIDRFVNARNYYTHYDQNNVEPSEREMIGLTENARFILICILLREIGFDEQEIVNAIPLYCRKRVTEIRSLAE